MAKAVPKEISLVTLIENANPAYNRYKLGDIDALAEDIHKNGLKVPVLITPGYQIIDGARRFEAIKKLGWDWVPTRITDEFYGALAGIRAARDQESPFEMRMGWLEMDNLIRFVLVPLYAPIRRERMSLAAKGQTSKRARGSDITDAIAQVFETMPSRVEAMRRLGALVQQAAHAPVLHAHMRSIVNDHDPGADEDWTKHITRAQRLMEEARDNYARTGSIQPAPPECLPVTEQLTRLRNISQMLNGLIREVKELGPINPEFPADEADPIRHTLYTAAASFGKVRTQLKKIIATEEG